ncbi:hypothetical protein D3227_21740 [Mesorhizobium waimense]|uniref:Uncharacterized protein n=1 Tax=Mesorhizobium waimense TaxID=1300307 RepID=A0A3A5KQ49_9HYPH|nr:hypothetical protein D3227_21740 [Mesorhizobium waimense]
MPIVLRRPAIGAGEVQRARAQNSSKACEEGGQAAGPQGLIVAILPDETPEKRLNANIGGVSEPALRASRIAEEIVAAA